MTILLKVVLLRKLQSDRNLQQSATMSRRSDTMHRRPGSDISMPDAPSMEDADGYITASPLASNPHWSPQSIAPAVGQAVNEVDIDLLCYALAMMTIEDPERSGPQYELTVRMEIDQPEVEDTTTDKGPVANLDEVKSQQVASEGSSSRAGRAASDFTAEVLGGPSSSSQEAGVQVDAVQPQGKAKKNKKKKKSQPINKHMSACLDGFQQSHPDVFLTPATAHARAVAAGAGTASDRYRRVMREPVQAPTSKREPSPAPRRSTHDKVASYLVEPCFGSLI
ncbi:hypothetical protein MAPG_08755 [Magnaporthiopsis poae ATCC 64411]|uniref:Uncharacterized protein n=1 Tax=Magnaporthiopsis poae (strain ATCC 64411 / 73-15) TaxID=644358 RepID=A0A0C4E865_MAGP6|nr:hypothetical protein MAPG_08755 [Magnaporthiopsis poae ATCC 64411]